MGFYLRKSFRAGPIRFNLSKSGIGASFGVTGARLGVSSAGRAYVHGGRGGLYYRKSIGGGGGGRAGGGRADSGRTRRARPAAPGPIELTEDTGVTYGAPREQEQAPDAIAAPVRRSPPTYGWLALGAVAASLLLPSPYPAVVAAGAFAALVALGARRGKRRAAGDAYGRLLDARVAAADPITDDERSAIDTARRDPRLTSTDARYFEERAYLGLLEAAAANGAAEPQAFEQLGVCAAEKIGPNIKWNAALLTTTCSSRSCRKSSYGADS